MVFKIQDWRFQKLEEEEEWEASRIFEGVADGDVAEVFVNVPSGAPELSVEDIIVSTEGKLKVERFANVSEDTEGDSMIVSNKKINGGTAAPFDFRTGGVGETGVYSGGVKQEENLITGAITGNKVGGGSESRPALIVAPGNNYLLRFTNQSGQVISFSVQFEFAEVQ